MNISLTTTYAIKAMLHIAHFKKDKFIKGAEIAEKQNIPKIYLFKVMNNLQIAGVIKSKRGAQGGYFLARNADKITLLDIFRATDSSLTPSICLLGDGDCGGIIKCNLHNVWAKANEEINDILNGFTLKMLQDRKNLNDFDLN